MLKRHIAVGLAALLLPLVAAGDEVYRWTDEEGQPVYSDKPRPKAERVEIDSDSGSQGETSRTAQGSEASEQGEQDQCEKWKSQLEVLQNSDEIYREGEDGEREVLSDEEVQLEIERAKLKIDEHCDEGAASP